MANPIWPITLPQDQFVGLTDERADARLRTPMDVGPAKMRRRFTATTRNVTIPVLFTGAERVLFDEFYIDTLNEGTLVFDWEDPVTDVTVEFRFTAPSRFKLLVGGGTAARLWEGELHLEIMP